MKKLFTLFCIPVLLFAMLFGVECGDKKTTSSEEKKDLIALVTTNVSMAEETTFQLEVVLDESVEEGRILVWSSSDTSVVTVDQNGLLTAVKKGTAICSVSCGKDTARCVITVTDYQPEDSFSIALTQEEFSLNVGGEYNLYNVVTAKFGAAEVTGFSIAGVSDDATVVSLTDGVLMGLAANADGVNVLLTVSADVDGASYQAQALITVYVY